MTTDLLRQQLAEVAERRANAETCASLVKTLRDDFEAEHAEVIAAAATAKAALADAEASARALIVAIYETTGSKAPAVGASVRVSTKLEYDPAEAFAKAKAMGVAVIPESLDVKAWEKIVKASPATFPFVRVVEQPSATLASDLSAYLAPAPSDAADLTPNEIAEIPF